MNKNKFYIIGLMILLIIIIALFTFSKNKKMIPNAELLRKEKKEKDDLQSNEKNFQKDKNQTISQLVDKPPKL